MDVSDDKETNTDQSVPRLADQQSKELNSTDADRSSENVQAASPASLDQGNPFTKSSMGTQSMEAASSNPPDHSRPVEEKDCAASSFKNSSDTTGTQRREAASSNPPEHSRLMEDLHCASTQSHTSLQQTEIITDTSHCSDSEQTVTSPGDVTSQRTNKSDLRKTVTSSSDVTSKENAKQNIALQHDDTSDESDLRKTVTPPSDVTTTENAKQNIALPRDATSDESDLRKTVTSSSDVTTTQNAKQNITLPHDAMSDVASTTSYRVISDETISDVIKDLQEDDVSQPDFTLLPDLVWVRVFQLLSLSERYHLSQVNWFLNSVFYDGRVWRNATINFPKALVHGYFYVARHRLTLPEKEKKLTRKFGHFYRDVTLRVSGRPEELEDDTRQILHSLQETWRLEALTLDIGDREWGNRYQGEDMVNLSLLLEIASIIRQSTSLKSLDVQHWPQCYLITEESLQLAPLLSLGEFLKLRSLRLPRTTENGLETVRAARELAVDCVTKFRCLRHLYVTSSVLSDALFQALVKSRDDRLRTLSIEVCGLWSTGDLNHLMAHLSWDTLTSRCPGLEVAMTMNADVPAFAFARFLVPEIPLVSMTFDINCHCYRKAIQLLEQYSDTLREFRCLSYPQDCEMELLSMVHACPKLRHLTFHGDLSDLRLLELAEAGGRRWGTFRFVWSRIEKTKQRPTPFNLVAATRRDLDLDHDLDLTEEEVKAAFCAQVSRRLGYPWQPEVS